MQQKPSFSVYPYHRGRLKQLLANRLVSPEEELTSEYLTAYKALHLTYFDDYFDELKAKSVIAEFDYVDRDYLEDYAAYYVRCFRELHKKCVRLHFFRSDWSAEKFAALLTESSADPKAPKLLEDDYLGFIVVRPLPDAVFGRTCIRTYPSDCVNADVRCFPVSRQYDLSLFGIPLSISTLAFQEQDTVAAACASSALWSAFQATCKLYGHEALSPIEVTRRATQYYVGMGRPVPSKGLAPNEMIRAIRSIGLESHTYQLLDTRIDEATVKALVYAYARMGAPVILGLHLFDVTNNAYIGAHAVTVPGYRISAATPGSSVRVSFYSDRVVKIYVNDDHIGPFARMEFVSSAYAGNKLLMDLLAANLDFSGNEPIVLTTNWGVVTGTEIVAVPDLAIIPVYHKMRIELPAIAGCVQEFDARVLGWCAWVRSRGKKQNSGLEWEVFLDTISSYRKDIRNSKDLASDLKLNLLTAPMPRFLWRAIGLDGGKRKVELVFDATGVERGRLFLVAITYDKLLSSMLVAFAQNRSLRKTPFASSQISWILDSFL